MKTQVSTIHASKKVIIGDKEITPEDVARWNSPTETPRELETTTIKTSELIIGDFTFSAVEGVFKIVHVSGAEWKFAPSSD
jgi:hypothetical protein